MFCAKADQGLIFINRMDFLDRVGSNRMIDAHAGNLPISILLVWLVFISPENTDARRNYKRSLPRLIDGWFESLNKWYTVWGKEIIQLILIDL